MIKIAEITNAIMEGVYPTLEQNGFFLNKKEREFKRSISDCVQIFDMLFYKKSTHISVKPEVRIKILSIEKIYSEATEIDGRYEELVQIYEEELQDAANSYKEEFYKLKELLKGY